MEIKLKRDKKRVVRVDGAQYESSSDDPDDLDHNVRLNMEA